MGSLLHIQANYTHQGVTTFLVHLFYESTSVLINIVNGRFLSFNLVYIIWDNFEQYVICMLAEQTSETTLQGQTE